MHLLFPFFDVALLWHQQSRNEKSDIESAESWGWDYFCGCDWRHSIFVRTKWIILHQQGWSISRLHWRDYWHRRRRLESWLSSKCNRISFLYARKALWLKHRIWYCIWNYHWKRSGTDWRIDPAGLEWNGWTDGQLCICPNMGKYVLSQWPSLHIGIWS